MNVFGRAISHRYFISDNHAGFCVDSQAQQSAGFSIFQCAAGASVLKLYKRGLQACFQEYAALVRESEKSVFVSKRRIVKNDSITVEFI